MLHMTPEDWIELRRKYLTDVCVCVMGYPSRNEADRIAETVRFTLLTLLGLSATELVIEKNMVHFQPS
ncbi:unnamed protein product [Gongylonema pulchrum]|uniref:DUF4279 domain-containing protein n=1 Tax=Gongylonema pulchrum TaxID=637853 RepID=A0A183DKN6_9BILA|nr:unnamed protein product [Gongylonema pulchrum]